MNNNKRFLIVTNTDEFGGTRTYLNNLLNFYKKKDLDIHVATENASRIHDLLKEHNLSGIKVHQITNRTKYYARFMHLLHPLTILSQYLAMKNITTKVGPDLIIISPAGTGSYMSTLLINIPQLFVVHSYPRTKLPICYQILKKISLSKPHYLTVSNYAKKSIEKYWQVDCKYIYNPPMKYKKTRKKYMKELILTVGHLEWYKNPDIWIEVAQKIIKKKSNFPYKFIWIGDGTLEKQIKTKVKKLGLSKHCKVLKSRSDLSSFYERSLIYFQPSLIESQGIAVATAQNMGIPCVVSKVGGLPEMVKHKQTGFVVNEENSEKMTTAIEELIKNKRLREEFSKKSTKYMRNTITMDKWNSQMDEIHEEIGVL